MNAVRFIKSLLVWVFVIGLLSPMAAAHPEDEFCTPGSGVDPALCRALQAIDRADATTDEPALLVIERTAMETFQLYVQIGTTHILPSGWDHILFVVALCFGAYGLRALLLQVSIFTVAHTTTLGLVAAGIFTPAAAWVEPLIALTIAILAIEILFQARLTVWRLGVIFVFGLIHGMGFAGFFGTLGLPAGQFWSALFGFNLGVEIGQLAVILLTFLALYPIRKRLSQVSFQRRIVVPASCLIAAIALFWTVERIFGV